MHLSKDNMSHMLVGTHFDWMKYRRLPTAYPTGGAGVGDIAHVTKDW